MVYLPTATGGWKRKVPLPDFACASGKLRPRRAVRFAQLTNRMVKAIISWPAKASIGLSALPATATLGALGIVYGDIGTSPLYALKEAVKAATAG
jgi:K+ potassium transporter